MLQTAVLIVGQFLCCFWLISVSGSEAARRARQVEMADVPTGQTLTACLLVERDTVGIIYDYNRARAAIDMALEYVNEFILSATTDNYRLSILYRDIGPDCSGKTHIVGHAMDLMVQGVHCDVYIGPGCGLACESLNDLAEFYDTPIIGCPAAGLGLSASAALYTMTVRVSVTYASVADTLLRFFTNFDYTSPYFLHDSSVNFFAQMGTVVKTTIQHSDSTLYYASKFDPFDGSDGVLTREEIRNILGNGSEISRVFVIFATADIVREFMIVAKKSGMTLGDFVYISVELYPSGIWGSLEYRREDSEDEIAFSAFESLLVLGLDLGVGDKTVVFWNQVISYSKERYNYTMARPNEIDPVVSHFYDAVILYGSVVKSMQEEGLDFFSGLALAAYVGLNQFTFESPVNGNVSFNRDSDRLFNYKMDSFDRALKKFDTLFEFPATNSTVRVLGPLSWVGGKQMPPNTPRCGFKGNDMVCAAERNALQIGTLVAAVAFPAFFALISAIAAFFGVRKYMKEHADPYWWRILSYEMDFPAEHIIGFSSKTLSKGSQRTLEDSKINGNTHSDEDDHDSDTVSTHTEVPGTTAFYHGNAVSLRLLPEPRRPTPIIPREALMVRRVLHVNVQKFLGVAINDSGFCEYIVGEACQKGSLRDLLLNSSMDLDWEFKHSLIKDMTNGMTYLHGSAVVSHGFLDDTTCLIESRFVLKIAGFGFPSLRNLDDLLPVIPNHVTDRDYHPLLWRAPELLRRVMPPNGTQKGDIYSFAIILQQIILRSNPFQQRAVKGLKRKAVNLGPRDIVHEVRKGTTPPLRPPVPMSFCSKGLHALMESCWEEDSLARPPFHQIRRTAIKVIGRSGDNIVTYLIRQMERHAAELEEEVDKQMKQFMYERQRSADLLAVMLPKEVADALSKGITILPETYESTTVYFGDVAGFADAIAQTTSPFGIVDILNGLYNVCDHVIQEFQVFKVETVSDAYLIVSGLPVRNGKRHIEEVASMAIALRKDIGAMKLDAAPNVSFKLRVGLNSGSCVAGVIGSKMPRYCLFGDTVNTASRMESHGEAGKIHMSSSSNELLKDHPQYIIVPRGAVNIKGKGPMETYWLVGKTA